MNFSYVEDGCGEWVSKDKKYAIFACPHRDGVYYTAHYEGNLSETEDVPFLNKDGVETKQEFRAHIETLKAAKEACEKHKAALCTVAVV
jgi:hypothetical protein